VVAEVFSCDLECGKRSAAPSTDLWAYLSHKGSFELDAGRVNYEAISRVKTRPAM